MKCSCKIKFIQSKKDLCLEQDIEGFLVLQKSLGHQRISYEPQLHSFEKYVNEFKQEATAFTYELIIGYLEQQVTGLYQKASTLRMFGRYLSAIGKDAYIIPKNMYRVPHVNSPYIFTDQELHDLFKEIDRIDPKKGGFPVLLLLCSG